ncbi:MaoC family dehydratase [Rathayibacter sp. VKM Ac-2630]|uniref:MaoC family dehydratase n=1 Tax=Rathayibacter sp. VKM Ac-2630 TaxID=1938617 RepID=UPI000981831A|nr:MaoC family dehydratase [Rathayibacter sp. VKM Ac-2630]OOB90891.1 acyl dehydratase [Rathayibacter sp. VKM Ac-2630]
MEPFTVPLSERYFDDYSPGLGGVYGPIAVTEAEIIAFATAFDPHTMHTDPDAARAGDFGGLIASGWHTTAMMMRLLVDTFLNERASIASPGVDDLRWHLPVRPGDRLRGRFVVLSARPSASRPDRGLVRIGIELIDQHDATVMSQTLLVVLRRSPLGS